MNFFQNEFKLNYGLSWSKKYDAIKIFIFTF